MYIQYFCVIRCFLDSVLEDTRLLNDNKSCFQLSKTASKNVVTLLALFWLGEHIQYLALFIYTDT